jgi:hypothetical protein
VGGRFYNFKGDAMEYLAEKLIVEQRLEDDDGVILHICYRQREQQVQRSGSDQGKAKRAVKI